MIEGEDLAKACAGYAEEKQAEDILILDLRGISSITDYFVICSGTSRPHLKAIWRAVADRLREEHDLRPSSMEGELESRWMVLDYGDVLVHVFHEEMRPFYALEDLWSDAPVVEFEAAAGAAQSGERGPESGG